MINRLRYKQASSILILFAISMQLFSFTILGQSFKNDTSRLKVEHKQEVKQEIKSEQKSRIAPDLEDVFFSKIHQVA